MTDSTTDTTPDTPAPEPAEPVLEARAVALDPSEEEPKIDRRATRTLYPTGDAHIVGDALVGNPAAVITHANPAAAERMLEYSPPAFSVEPTDFSRTLEGVPEAVLLAYPPPPDAAQTSEG